MYGEMGGPIFVASTVAPTGCLGIGDCAEATIAVNRNNTDQVFCMIGFSILYFQLPMISLLLQESQYSHSVLQPVHPPFGWSVSCSTGRRSAARRRWQTGCRPRCRCRLDILARLAQHPVASCHN